MNNRLIALGAMGVLIAGCTHHKIEPVEDTRVKREWFFVVSKGLPDTRMKDAERQFVKLVSTVSAPGDRIHLISAQEKKHESVASLTVPTGSPGARLRSKELRGTFPKTTHAFESSGAKHAGLLYPALPAALNCETEYPKRLILFGSPIYAEPGQEGLHMHDGVVGSDTTIGALYSPVQTDPKYPEGLEAILVADVSGWGTDARHRKAITRYVRAVVQEQSGHLILLTDDPGKSFNFDSPQFTDRIVLDGTVDPGLISVSTESRRRPGNWDMDAVQVPLVRPGVGDTGERVLGSFEDAVRHAEGNDKQILIAILWTSEDPNVDLDMRISSQGKEGELFHGNRKLPWGELQRDVQKSNPNINDNQDLRRCEYALINHDRIKDLTLWVNVYSAQKPSTIRVVRVWKGERKEREIKVKCMEGDGGANAHWRQFSSAWVRVELHSYRADAETGDL